MSTTRAGPQVIEGQVVEEQTAYERFFDEYLVHTLSLIVRMEEATSEREFREHMAEVQRDVAAWPTE